MVNQENMVKEKYNISIVIPCYNSEKTIGTVVDGIMKALGDYCDPRIILVNDHSVDHVWNVISDICGNHKNVIGLSVKKFWTAGCPYGSLTICLRQLYCFHG